MGNEKMEKIAQWTETSDFKREIEIFLHGNLALILRAKWFQKWVCKKDYYTRSNQQQVTKEYF